MNYYLEVIKKYAEFSGRSRRSEYWYFILINFIVTLFLGIVSPFVGDDMGIVSALYALALFIPSLAVSVRRLHDVGKSGWMLLLLIIPIIGAIWILLLTVRDSEPGNNKYGPNPKGV